MSTPSFDDNVERLRRQLKAKIDAAAQSFAEVLHVVSDLLIEIAQHKTAPIAEKPEAKTIQEMLTIQEAAEYLGVKPSTLAAWRCTRRYDVPAVKIGKRLRYRKSDLDKFIELRTKASKQRQ